MSLLTVQNLNVQFYNRVEHVEAVRSVSFSIEPGEIVGVIGKSGSGKSTLMRAVMGLLPENADVSFEQCCMTGGRDKIAMVFQDPLTYLNPTRKVGHQITETVRAHRKVKYQEAVEQALKYMDMAGIRNARERMNQYPFELSGGQRQRIVLAIALACEPELLIADEPTTALDVTIQRQILERLKQIADETKTAVLIVSHDLGVIASFADRVLVMKDGEIVESGPVDKIFWEPEHPYTKELFEFAKKSSVFRDWKRAPRKIPDQMPERKSLKEPEKILCVDHLQKCYEKKTFLCNITGNKKKKPEAVYDVSFSLYAGETLGIVGESGSGKTTLGGMLTGIVEPTAGELIYHGEKLLSLHGGRQHSQIRKIQMVFQDISASLDPRCSVGETLEEPLIVNKIGTRRQRKEKVYETLKLAGLKREDAEKYPRALSGGQRQRIGIARALILEPEILVLDEPVSALDPAIQEQMLVLLEQIQREKGLTYVFISHDLNVVRRISQRLAVMYAGRFVETGSTKEIYQEPWHPYTKALLAAVLPADPVRARKRKPISTLEEPAEVKENEGCPYASRCGYVMDRCKKECPGIYRFGTREVACFLYSEQHTGKQSESYEQETQI